MVIIKNIMMNDHDHHYKHHDHYDCDQVAFADWINDMFLKDTVI